MKVAVTKELRRLIIAARNVAYDGCAGPELLRELDKAVEEFAAVVSWQDEPHGDDLTHTSGYAETIEESPEDVARAACERAGMVAVAKMTASEADAWVARYVPANYPEIGFGVLETLGLIVPDPTPLDIAKEEHPHIKPEDVERIFKMGEGAK